MTKSILFICTGNSCRSVMAEGLLRKRLDELGRKDVEVSSAGVRALNGMGPTDETAMVMDEEGVDVSGHKTRNVSVGMINGADLIFAMEPAHKAEIISLVPAAGPKTFLLKEYRSAPGLDRGGPGVSDPIGKSMEYYRAIRDEIKGEIERFADRL